MKTTAKELLEQAQQQIAKLNAQLDKLKPAKPKRKRRSKNDPPPQGQVYYITQFVDVTKKGRLKRKDQRRSVQYSVDAIVEDVRRWAKAITDEPIPEFEDNHYYPLMITIVRS